MWLIVKVSAMRIVVVMLLFLSSGLSGKLTISWKENFLRINDDRNPGGALEVWYLEAYCRAGSTDREWNETVIDHETKLLSATETEIKLRCQLADGVIIDHLIKAEGDKVSFRLIAKNPTGQKSEAHWGQPCIRVGEFTGTRKDANKYAYLKDSFVFLNDKKSFMPTDNWATSARYVPGQVWCPCHVPKTDLNPRPLSMDQPSNGLIGCISADKKWLMATAWDPYQELFQGVIRCLHSDFRIGGLEVGEEKIIRGAIYVMANDVSTLIKRYEEDFPAQVRRHRTLSDPEVVSGDPVSGKRVSITTPDYSGTNVHHTLYLPENWNPDWKEKKKSYPLIVEYSGNRAPSLGSSGRVEDSVLGYGLSSGEAVWLNLPFVDAKGQANQPNWWGDEAATAAYAKKVVPKIMAEYGIDPDRVILCGFSRGAIAVNYIGLHDDEIAALWSGFVTHDHYDGVMEWRGTKWGAPLPIYRKAAAERFKRINGRPVLICQNGGTSEIRKVIGSPENVSFLDVDTRAIFGIYPTETRIHPHTDRWLLKPSAQRNKVLDWMEKCGFF